MEEGTTNGNTEQMAKKEKTKKFGNSIKFPLKNPDTEDLLTPEQLHDAINQAIQHLDPDQSYKFCCLFVTPVDQSTIKNPRTIQITGPHRTAAEDFNL